ncbi:MAG TPA: ABC transporter ATP-binding protein [Candidatus Dormibacteraeota bacterium]|nr:ABC transporter ATP-binding protein [Candidatus Dormibacteraeota bacterium]
MASPTASGPAIVAERVAVQYGNRLVWQDATFSVDPGEFVAILGPNGAGKSTLFRLLLGLVPAAAGTLQVLGRRPHRGDPAIGYVPQRRNIDRDLPIRGRDFVHLGIDGNRWGVAVGGAAENRQRVEEAVAAVNGLDYADRPIGRLSGGEQQRLLLAQALAGRPQMLLLDEPLASLDLRNQIVISELVADLAKANGLTVLLIAHDINPLLRIVDRVIYVAHGGVAIGKPAEVITTERLSRLYDSPVEVLHDDHGHMFVVGLEAESAHHDG